MRHAQGQVVDETTGEPIPDVEVVGHFISDRSVHTDSLGRFALSGITGHIRCRPIRVTVSAAGYTHQDLRLSGGTVIRLRKQTQ